MHTPAVCRLEQSSSVVLLHEETWTYPRKLRQKESRTVPELVDTGKERAEPLPCARSEARTSETGMYSTASSVLWGQDPRDNVNLSRRKSSKATEGGAAPRCPWITDEQAPCLACVPECVGDK